MWVQVLVVYLHQAKQKDMKNIQASQIQVGNTLDGLSVIAIRKTDKYIFVTIDVESFQETVKYSLTRLVNIA